jgi:hypothetical protein
LASRCQFSIKTIPRRAHLVAILRLFLQMRSDNHQAESLKMSKTTEFWRWLDMRSYRATVLWGLLLAMIIEIITCMFRFGLHLQSTRDTRAMAGWTLGFRIHHAYPGALLLLVALVVGRGGWRTLLLLVGIGLVVSDLAHHFVVLWPLTGDPQFHIRYADLVMMN